MKREVLPPRPAPPGAFSYACWGVAQWIGYVLVAMTAYTATTWMLSHL